MDFREKELSEDCSESKKSTDIIPDDVRTLFVVVRLAAHVSNG